jgi:phospholipase C
MAQLIIILCLLTSALSAERQAPERVQYTPKQIAACKKINHIIVIMQENWSFDGLYGMFPGVNGIANASEESMRQLDAKGSLSPNLPVCINTKKFRPHCLMPLSISSPTSP